MRSVTDSMTCVPDDSPAVDCPNSAPSFFRSAEKRFASPTACTARTSWAMPIPRFSATDSIVARSELCSCRDSATIRTARSRNSGGYFLDVDDINLWGSRTSARANHAAC